MKIFWFILLSALALNLNHAFGAEGGMPQLNPEYWPAQIFWLILIFSGLYIVIWKIFLPKISVSIENRKLRVVNDLNETEKLKEYAEIKFKEYNKIIEDSKTMARKIVEVSKKKSDNDIKEKKKKFNEEIDKELLVTEREIKSLKKSSILNINKIAIEVSCEVLKEIIKTEVNMSNVSAIVENISKKEIEKHL